MVTINTYECLVAESLFELAENADNIPYVTSDGGLLLASIKKEKPVFGLRGSMITAGTHVCFIWGSRRTHRASLEDYTAGVSPSAGGRK